MRLTRLLMVLLLPLALAGCAAIRSDLAAVKSVAQTKVLNPFNDATVQDLNLTLLAFATVLDDYTALPRCPKGIIGYGAVTSDGRFCHDYAIANDWRGVIVVARRGMGDLVTLEKTHPPGTVIFNGKFSQVQQLVATVGTYVTAYQNATK